MKLLCRVVLLIECLVLGEIDSKGNGNRKKGGRGRIVRFVPSVLCNFCFVSFSRL